MKTLFTLFTILFSFSISFAQMNVSVSMQKDSTYSMLIQNMSSKEINSTFKREISYANLSVSHIQYDGITIGLQRDTITLTSANGQVKELKTKSYYIVNSNNDTTYYTHLNNLKKDMPTPKTSFILANKNQYNFRNNSVMLYNQTRENVAYTLLRTINVRTSKNNPTASQTIEILGNIYEVKGYAIPVVYTNEESTISKTYQEKRYSVNGVVFQRLSEIKGWIKNDLGL